MSEAAFLVRQLIKPAQFVQLVAAERGGEVPPADCGLKQFIKFKHRSSNAVGVVITAVLQGKVADLEQKIQQRRLSDAQCADGENEIAAAMLLFQQELNNLQQPDSIGLDGDRPTDRQLDAAVLAVVDLSQPEAGDLASDSGAAPAAAVPTAAVTAAAAAAGEGGVQDGTKAAAGAEPKSVRQHGLPAVTPSPAPPATGTAAAAAGAGDAAEPPAKKLKAEGELAGLAWLRRRC